MKSLFQAFFTLINDISLSPYSPRDYDTDDDDDDDDRNDENGNTSDTDSPLDSNFFSTGSKTNETILKKADVTQLVLSDVEVCFNFVILYIYVYMMGKIYSSGG
ncbi:unnamed protein product [Trichobilharzia regenti]|nr:unnamed protein product [Trichobilharzia regenti]